VNAKRFRRVYGIAVLSLTAATQARGQATNVQPPAPPLASASSQEATDDIIVTAQKRAQALQDVGITLNAFSAEELVTAGIKDAVDVARLAPAVSLAGSYGGQSLTFAIRGIGQQDFSGHAEAPTAIYADEGYLAYNNASGVGLFDIDRIEVLKGPQGTLFGRNATGGLVHIISKKPSIDQKSYVTLSYGSYNEARFEGAVGGALNDKIMVRFAALAEQNDSYIKNIHPIGEGLGALKRFAQRGHLLIKPSSELELLLTGYNSRSKFSWTPYYSDSTRVVTDSKGTIVDSILINGPTLLGTVPPQGFRVNVDNARNSGGYSRLSGGTAKITWDPGIEITSVTDYKHARTRFRMDAEATEINFLDDQTVTSVKNFSQEIRLFKDAGVFRGYAGGYYLHIAADVVDDVIIAPLGAFLRQGYGMDTDSYSGFGQVEVDLTPQFTVIGGLRITRETKDYHYSSLLFALVPPLGQGPFLAPFRSPFDGKRGDTLVTAKAQIEYRPGTNVLLYAGWNRGSKAGSFNAPYAGSFYPDDQMPYDPEVLNAFEAGAKTDIIDGLRLNGAAFYYNYKDYQSFKFVGLTSQITNQKAEIYGGEVEIVATPMDGLKLQVAASYTDAKVFDVSVNNVNFDSRVPPFTSKWQANAAANYEFPFIAGTLSLHGDLSYRSSSYYSVTNYSSTRIKGYTLLGANISWASSDDQWRVDARVTNLTNRRYKTVGFDISSLCGCSQVGRGEPRWFTAAITRNF
jgi:iron complex outermembrane receptor protein